MLNLHHHKICMIRREPGREGKILSDHKQDGNVAVGGTGNLARSGPSAVREIHTTAKTTIAVTKSTPCSLVCRHTADDINSIVLYCTVRK